ncbi:MAG: DUF3810 domain-containing protein [Lachnospiraceae bacterium]
MKNKKKGIAALVLFGGSLLLLLVAQLHTGFSQWYSKECYPILVRLVGGLCSVVPFSVAELCLYILGVFVFITLCRLGLRIFQKKAGKKEVIGAMTTAVLAASILFLIFTLGCGLNYRRISFSEETKIQTRKYSVEELVLLCKELTQEVNQWSAQVPRDGNGTAMDGTSMQATQKAAVHTMNQLGEQYPSLAGYYPRPKALLMPELLSYQNISGVYSPFTIEANYNNDMTPYNIPFTMCHELSHLRGFMQEEEANFIAYLACEVSDSMEFKYSGSLLAWIYSTNVLCNQAPQEYEALRASLSPQVRKDLEENSIFWDRYEGAVADVADRVNDTYLKANGQSDGVESYDRMVDLLVVYKLDSFSDSDFS